MMRIAALAARFLTYLLTARGAWFNLARKEP